MLIQALAEYADRNLGDQLEDPAFERKRVPLELELSADGRFLGWIERAETVQMGKRSVQRALVAEVPRSPVNRNSGVHPLLAFDEAKYLLGAGPWTKPGQEADHEAKHAGFVQFLRTAAQETQDPALNACVKFYDSLGELDRARAGLDEKVTGGILLSVAPEGPVIRRPAVKAFWREHYKQKLGHRNEAGGVGMCLVSGRWGSIAPTHDKIKGTAALGGQASGVALMSFDKAAFQSYGWDKNANSPVSPDRAQAYVMALNHLLANRDHRVDRNGMGFLFWLREETKWNPVSFLEQATVDEVRQLVEMRKEGWRQLAPNQFYFLAVKGNGGRLQVCQWIHESLDRTLANVADWFEGLKIINAFTGEAAEPPKMWQLLDSLARDHPPPGRALELTRRALLRQPLGLSVLNAALVRVRLEQGSRKLDPVRAGLIRLLVNDEIQKQKGGSKMSEELNPGEQAPAYLCGRLLALFDSLQYQASDGKLNQTVADRYYSLASTQPRLAFPKLEDLGLKHLRKVRRNKPGAAINIERQMDEVRSQLGSVFPAALSLVDQGRFALGYHHERAAGMQRASAKKQEKEEQGEAL